LEETHNAVLKNQTGMEKTWKPNQSQSYTSSKKRRHAFISKTGEKCPKMDR